MSRVALYVFDIRQAINMWNCLPDNTQTFPVLAI